MKKIDSIAIIAGQGILPRIVYDECVAQNIKCCVIGLKDEVNEDIFTDVKCHLFHPYAISMIFEYLKEEGIYDIVIAGKVNRRHLSKLVFDKFGRAILKHIASHGFNDSSIYSTIIKTIENEGFNLISPEIIAQNLISKSGLINNVEITEQASMDINKGGEILRGIMGHDIGQALIINNGLVLGVEAAEGTNNLIKRCAELREEQEGGVLIKLCKPHQDKRLDLPCIGPDTIKNIAKYGYKGIVVEAKKSIMLSSAKTIKLADDNKIFIYGV